MPCIIAKRTINRAERGGYMPTQGDGDEGGVEVSEFDPRSSLAEALVTTVTGAVIYIRPLPNGRIEITVNDVSNETRTMMPVRVGKTLSYMLGTSEVHFTVVESVTVFQPVLA
jgi:hypothetical protein